MTTLFKRQDINLMTYQRFLTNLGKKILNLVEKYLGSNIYCYDNTILKLGTIKSKIEPLVSIQRTEGETCFGW